jgi:predicted dehydrogenase
VNYAIIGTGSRSYMYSDALLGDFKDRHNLVALCDLNQVRMDVANKRFKERYGVAPRPTYKPSDFDKMLRDRKVDTLIVTSIDRTHHEYAIRAMEAGCDVISEKPMTIDAEKCRAILDAIQRTGRKYRVTFNYRYAPRNSKVKELLMQGVIGDIKSVHFEWLLDTVHGADYFRRWHRDKRNSGGLMVHKASHHFDLVNWWIASTPATVFGMGDLQFYGRANAEARGVTKFYDRATGHPNAAGDPFALDLSKDDKMREMYLQAEGEDGYRRDESVFGHYISIEDDMGLVVRYANGAIMSYHLTAYSPWEGYRIAFNGTKGRLEYDVTEKAYVSGSSNDANQATVRAAKDFEIEEPVRILVRPHWAAPVQIPFDMGKEGGHGGGDARMLRDIFVGGEDDPLGRAADHRAGAWAILTGIAANRSFASGESVLVEDLARP